MKSCENADRELHVPTDTHYDFGDFRLDASRRLLSHRAQGAVPITSRAFDTLLHFVRNPGRLVLKRELMDAVWGNAVVEENNLTQTISTLRHLLGERPDEHRFIVTVLGADIASSHPFRPRPRDRLSTHRNLRLMLLLPPHGCPITCGGSSPVSPLRHWWQSHLCCPQQPAYRFEPGDQINRCPAVPGSRTGVGRSCRSSWEWRTR